MEHIERGYKSVRSDGVGAGVRGCAEREANERHSKLGMLGRRGPWTTLSTAAGGETTPPRPSKGGQTGERHRGVTKGGVRGAVDNNNYYTRRSFANAVLRGWLATWGGKVGRSVDGVGAGNGRPLSRPVTSGGGRGRVRGETQEGGGGRRVILKRDRYASLSRALFLLSCALSTIASFLLPLLFLALPSFPTPIPYILGRSFHPLELPVRPSVTPSHNRRIVSGRLCESVLEESLHIRMRAIDVWARVYLCVAQCRSHVTYRVSRADAAPSVCPLLT